MRGKLARAWGALRPTSSYYTSAGVSLQMRAAVARLARERRYAVVVSELAMVDAIPPGDIPVVYAAQNSEATLLARRAKVEPPLARLALTIDALRVRRIEAWLIGRARMVTPCSQNDIDDMATFAAGVCTKAVIVPNGVDRAGYAHIAAGDGNPGVVLITGSFDWQPNRRGLLWFIKDVLPLLEAQRAGPEDGRRAGWRSDRRCGRDRQQRNTLTNPRGLGRWTPGGNDPRRRIRPRLCRRPRSGGVPDAGRVCAGNAGLTRRRGPSGAATRGGTAARGGL
jgi:hypothetical protein